jgi:hypothetical protein
MAIGAAVGLADGVGWVGVNSLIAWQPVNARANGTATATTTRLRRMQASRI